MTTNLPEPGVYDMLIEGVEPSDISDLNQWPTSMTGQLTNKQSAGYVTQLLTILTTEHPNE